MLNFGNRRSFAVIKELVVLKKGLFRSLQQKTFSEEVVLVIILNLWRGSKTNQTIEAILSKSYLN